MHYPTKFQQSLAEIMRFNHFGYKRRLPPPEISADTAAAYSVSNAVNCLVNGDVCSSRRVAIRLLR